MSSPPSSSSSSSSQQQQPPPATAASPLSSSSNNNRTGSSHHHNSHHNTTAATAGTTNTPTTNTNPGTGSNNHAGGGGSSTAPPSTTTTAAAGGEPPEPTKDDLTDQAVLEYLRKKGMSAAVMELTKRLSGDNNETTSKTMTMTATATGTHAGGGGGGGTGPTTTTTSTTTAEIMKERLEKEEHQYRTQKAFLTKTTGHSYGYDRDSAGPVWQWAVPDHNDNVNAAGVDEARAHVDAFVSLQLWVLGLPDMDDCYYGGNYYLNNDSVPGHQYHSSNPLWRAQQLIQQGGPETQISSIIEELAKPTTNNSGRSNTTMGGGGGPPSVKPELLAVTFALLIYTYLELLEVGMESTATMIRDVFQPIYEPRYGTQFRDLFRCQTTSDVVQLSQLCSVHGEKINKLKAWFIKISRYEYDQQELAKKVVPVDNPTLAKQKEQRLQEYIKHIDLSKQKYRELCQEAEDVFRQLDDATPFLRRAKAQRWQISMSNITYTTLWTFLNSRDESLLPMMALLQTKCDLHVEKRPPSSVPSPGLLLDDAERRAVAAGGGNGTNAANTTTILDVQWAAPVPRGLAAAVFGNGGGQDNNAAMIIDPRALPKFNMLDEYEHEKLAEKDRRVVDYNRQLLIHGFRRLEALERKRELDGLSAASKKRLREEGKLVRTIADPFVPSILLTTLAGDGAATAAALDHMHMAGSTAGATTTTSSDIAAIWEESGIGICCAQLSAPDGRRIAAGCDDAAVRIWTMTPTGSNDDSEHHAEPHQVLLGHKKGLPVFDVDWNPDGRCLLSAGGDGSIRLWDTMVTGPIGQTAPKGKLSAAPPAGPDDDVPGSVPEADTVKHGAELAIYRGHTPGSAVWSVAFAPSGYYFCTGGSDATARLWTTDRVAPVRLLAGHTSNNVNCVTWHPNCNYVLSGADDKTVRLWDVHTGRTVRLLTGSHAGIHAAQIAPSGRYAAASDFFGTVYLWDLGTGKLVTELRSGADFTPSLTHALAFSACGSALATGGEDGCIKIWDVRKDFIHENPLVRSPVKTYETKRTMVMDLCFSRRNLLLAAGKVLVPSPVVASGIK